MSTRRKLDLAGAKITLKAWNRLSAEQRAYFCEASVETSEDRQQYRRRLQAALEPQGGAVKELDAARVQADRALYTDRRSVPRCVSERLASAGATLAVPQWAAMDEVERYALFKLAQGGHEHANLLPALREFLG
jgi:hypothetical protein